jgi:signal transduction histidine kinase
VNARETFPNSPLSVTKARHLVTSELKSQPERVRDAVEMLVSELTTNCVRHTDSRFTVRVDVTTERVRVEVTDGGSGWPRMKFPAATAPNGRGLRIVDVLSERWGVDHLGGGVGKTVWFEVRAQDSDHPTPPA